MLLRNYSPPTAKIKQRTRTNCVNKHSVSSVSIVTWIGLGDGRNAFCFQAVASVRQLALGSNWRRIRVGTGNPNPRVKRPAREADH